LNRSERNALKYSCGKKKKMKSLSSGFILM